MTHHKGGILKDGSGNFLQPHLLPSPISKPRGVHLHLLRYFLCLDLWHHRGGDNVHCGYWHCWWRSCGHCLGLSNCCCWHYYCSCCGCSCCSRWLCKKKERKKKLWAYNKMRVCRMFIQKSKLISFFFFFSFFFWGGGGAAGVWGGAFTHIIRNLNTMSPKMKQVTLIPIPGDHQLKLK